MFARCSNVLGAVTGLRPACWLRCTSLCSAVTQLLHRVAGVQDSQGWFLWSAQQPTSSISQPAPGPALLVSEGQAAAAEAQPDSPQMQAAARSPASTAHAGNIHAAAGTSSGAQTQHRGCVDLVLYNRATQRMLRAWELKRPAVIPVAQQHAPDSVACWRARSGDPPPCTGRPDRWGTSGSCWCSHKGQAFNLSPGSQ